MGGSWLLVGLFYTFTTKECLESLLCLSALAFICRRATPPECRQAWHLVSLPPVLLVQSGELGAGHKLTLLTCLLVVQGDGHAAGG